VEEVFSVIDPEVAQEIADKTTEIIGYNILITDDAGIVIGSGDKGRVGTFHEASLETVQRGDMTSHDVAAAEKLEGVKPGVTLPVVSENRTVGTVGITGNPDEVKRFGMVVKSQTEIMLRESLHLRIALLEEKALESLVYDIANYDPAILEPEALVARGEELGYDLNLSRVTVVVDLAQFTHLASSYRLRPDNRTPELELQSLKLGVLRTIKDVFGDEQDVATSIGTGKFGVLHSLWPNEEDAMSRTRARCRHLAESIRARHEIVANVGIGTVGQIRPRVKGLVPGRLERSAPRQASGQAQASVPYRRVPGSGAVTHRELQQPQEVSTGTPPPSKGAGGLGKLAEHDPGLVRVGLQSGGSIESAVHPPEHPDLPPEQDRRAHRQEPARLRARLRPVPRVLVGRAGHLIG